MEVGRRRMKNDIYQDLDAVSGSRQALYAFLSRLFERELTEDVIKELQERTDAITQLEPLKGMGNKKLNSGLEHLDSYLKATRSTPKAEVQKGLSVEFAGLFQGGWPKTTHPSESHYATGGEAAKQKKRQAVAETYKSLGLDKSASFNEPDDHIAVELQFMSYLAKETAAAAKGKDQAKSLELLKVQHKFLNNHLGKWVGLLSNDVSKHAKSSFYKGAALVAAGFVEEDIKVVDDFIDDVMPKAKGS